MTAALSRPARWLRSASPSSRCPRGEFDRRETARVRTSSRRSCMPIRPRPCCGLTAAPRSLDNHRRPRTSAHRSIHPRKLCNAAPPVIPEVSPTPGRRAVILCGGQLPPGPPNLGVAGHKISEYSREFRLLGIAVTPSPAPASGTTYVYTAVTVHTAWSRRPA